MPTSPSLTSAQCASLIYCEQIRYCAAVSNAALESANVVGYFDVQAPTGDSMRSVVFKTVGGAAGYDLSKIKVTGGYGMGDISAQTIGSDGVWNGEYYWLTVDNGGVAVDGWYKDAFGAELVAEGEVILADGQALYVHSDYDDLSLTCAGEVAKGNVQLPFSAGDGMVGNAVPVETDLTDITVTGGYGMGDINAQAIGADGVWNGEFYWLTVDNGGVAADGWYKDAFGAEPVAADEIVLAPGESLYFHSDYDDLGVNIPAVL